MKKEPSAIMTGAKVLLAVMLIVALWPLIEVFMGAITTLLVLSSEIVFLILIFIVLAYLCGNAINSVKKRFGNDDTDESG